MSRPRRGASSADHRSPAVGCGAAPQVPTDNNAVRGPAPAQPAAPQIPAEGVRALVSELQRMLERLAIAKATCVTVRSALETAKLECTVDIGRTLTFGAADILASEYSRLYALIDYLKDGRSLTEWIGRWLP